MISYSLLPLILPPFQNVGYFDFFRFIYFAMDLDICFFSRCIANTINPKKPKQPTFWNGGSIGYNYINIRI